jgi:hypothetical protein
MSGQDIIKQKESIESESSYNRVFAVSRVKQIFQLKDHSRRHENNAIESKYWLKNLDLFDANSKELIEVGSEVKYNTEFLINLKEMYVMDIQPFLDFQLENSRSSEELYKYIKYAVKTELRGTLGYDAVCDWLQSNREVSKTKFTLVEIGLWYAYTREQITRENADAIAKRFGHNSGDKLYQYYTKYVIPNNRFGDRGSECKNNNQIKRIKKILPLLTEEQLETAMDELKMLENLTDKEY